MASKKPAETTDTIDLSPEIIQSVEKQVGDEVRCTRVTASTYRCNWWSKASPTDYDNPGMKGLLVTTHRIRKSRYLRVTKTDAGLVIQSNAGE